MNCNDREVSSARRRWLIALMFGVLFVVVNLSSHGGQWLASKISEKRERKANEQEAYLNHELELDLIQTKIELEDLKKRLDGRSRQVNASELWDGGWEASFQQKEKDLKEREAAFEESMKQKETTKKERDNHVAACVMVMDANHELIEWIAYHYHTLALRRLIILDDHKSKTTPEPILQRWKGRIDISLWNTTYVNPNPPEGKADDHIYWQFVFQTKCSLQLYDEGHRWVQLFDPDEYSTINERLYDPNDDMYGLGMKEGMPPIETPTMREANATLTFIKRVIAHVQKFGTYGNKYLSAFETPCITYKRKQYLPKDEEEEEEETTTNTEGNSNSNFPLGNIAPRDLSTYRWRYWAESDYLIGKTIMDFDRTDKSDFGKVTNMHFPLADTNLCRRNVLHQAEKEMPLVQNHYSGSLDQVLFRSGDSRGGAIYRINRYEREKKGILENLKRKQEYEPNGKVLEWLPGFIESVGKEEAERLLQYAGRPYKASIGAYVNPTLEITEEEGMKLQDQIIADIKEAEARARARQEADARAISPAYIGCYKDTSDRAMPHQQDGNFEALECLSKCQKLGHKFAGLQNGNQCYCGNTFDKHGSSNDKECNKSCGGKCGGAWRLSVYNSTKSISVGEARAKDEAEAKAITSAYIGCYKDKWDRAMPYEQDGDFKAMECLSQCQKLGHKFAGLQNGNQCFCGNTYDKHGSSDDKECDRNCAGRCGGVWRISVYNSTVSFSVNNNSTKS